MKKSIGKRLTSLEAKRSPRKKAVIIMHYKNETEEGAYARHYAKHPEDKGAELTVILVRVV